jgi:hypothetical protein
MHTLSFSFFLFLFSVWFAPSVSDGGSRITTYSATAAAQDGDKKTVTGTSSPLTVSGLANGKLYFITVAAANADGSSPPSIASKAVLPDAALPGTCLCFFLHLFARLCLFLYFFASLYPFIDAVDCVESRPGLFASLCTLPSIASKAVKTVSHPHKHTQTHFLGIPADIVAYGGDHRVMITFSPPPLQGATPVKSYKATVQPGWCNHCSLDSVNCYLSLLLNAFDSITLASVHHYFLCICYHTPHSLTFVTVSFVAFPCLPRRLYGNKCVVAIGGRRIRQWCKLHRNRRRRQ